MRILFDTNVLLDVLLAREPFAQSALRLLDMADRGKIEGLLCATTITTIHYLTTKALGAAAARKSIRTMMKIFTVAAVDGDVLTRALDLPMKDYEDAVLHESAIVSEAQGIVTRNVRDFVKSRIPVYSPDELLAVLTLRSK
ncbi:MAG: PIN domain-containing protein [Bacteroidota bacterium]